MRAGWNVRALVRRQKERAAELERLTKTNAFVKAYRKATKHQREELKHMLSTNDSHGVAWWLECYSGQKLPF